MRFNRSFPAACAALCALEMRQPFHTLGGVPCRPSCAVPALVVVLVIGAVVVTVTTPQAQGLRVTISTTTSASIPVHPCAMSPHIVLDLVQDSAYQHHIASDSVHCVGSVTLTPCQRLSKPCNSSDKIQGFSSLTMKYCAFCMKCATKSGCFALFSDTSGTIRAAQAYPTGLEASNSSAGLPSQIPARTKKSPSDNSEFLKNLREQKVWLHEIVGFRVSMRE